jgi:hypothetical protein
METTDVIGLLIVMGTFMTVSIILCSEMERKLRRVDRVIKQIEEDTRYVN